MMISSKVSNRKLATSFAAIAASAGNPGRTAHFRRRPRSLPETQSGRSEDGSGRNGKPESKGLALLNNQELEIVRRIVTGYSNKDIAQELDLSEQATQRQLFKIFDKLGVSNRMELALYAVSHNIAGFIR